MIDPSTEDIAIRFLQFVPGHILTGAVRNGSAKRLREVIIFIDFYSDGRAPMTRAVTVRGLAPGADQRFALQLLPQLSATRFELSGVDVSR